MKIGIMGLAGTPCRQVAELVSSRLGIQLYEMTGTLEEAIAETAALDSYIICNNFLADVCACYRIGLYSSIMSDEMFACSWQEKRDAAVFTKQELLGLDIFMDVTNMPVDKIVGEVLRLLYSGQEGAFINPELVLPSDTEEVVIGSGYFDTSRKFSVYMEEDCYKLTGNDSSAYRHLTAGTLLPVDIYAHEVSTSSSNRMLNMLPLAVRFYELLLFKRKFEFPTSAAAYVNACRNSGKPMARVHALGVNLR